MLSDMDSLKTFMKNNDIVINNFVDGKIMVDWLKDSKEVNNRCTKIFLTIYFNSS